MSPNVQTTKKHHLLDTFVSFCGSSVEGGGVLSSGRIAHAHNRSSFHDTSVAKYKENDRDRCSRGMLERLYERERCVAGSATALMTPRHTHSVTFLAVTRDEVVTELMFSSRVTARKVTEMSVTCVILTGHTLDTGQHPSTLSTTK